MFIVVHVIDRSYKVVIFALEMNSRICDLLKAATNELESKVKNEYHDELKKLIPTVTKEQSDKTYNMTMSFRNSRVANIGKLFEKIIEDELKRYNINYMSQVSVDIDARKFREGKKAPLVDFVIRNDSKNILSSPMSECILLSCKYTCRERWNQDTQLYEMGKKYILCVSTDDYPKQFKDTDKRSLIVLVNKKNCNRKTFDDFLPELGINENTECELRAAPRGRTPKSKIPCIPSSANARCTNDSHITYIDLCCGIGSFHYSMQRNFPNSKCVLASDILKDAVDTYALNYNITPEGDLKNIDYSKYDADIVFSGNPCQSFSQIGQHGGFEDERGNLFLYIIDNIMSLAKYPIFVFENVSGLISHDGGNTLRVIKDKINSYGYDMTYKVLSCNDYGIPQNRKRVFIICSYIHNFDEIERAFNKTLEEEKPIKRPTLTQYLNNGHTFQKDVAYTIRCGGLKSPISSRQNWDGYYVDDGKEYRLSVDDMKKLQGFDTSFRMCGKATTLLGNTIPTCLSSVITKVVGKLIQN